MSIFKDRPSKTGVFSPGQKTISANELNRLGQYIDQSRVGIHSGNVMPSETAGGTLIEINTNRRGRGAVTKAYHPWQIVTFTDDLGNKKFYVWPATVCNYQPKFMGSELGSDPKPSKAIQEGTWYVWCEVKGVGSSTYYEYPKNDGETPLIVVDQQGTKGNYDDKSYLFIGSIKYTKEVKVGDQVTTPESLVVSQFATVSVWTERIKCGTSPAEYFWSH